MSHPEPHPPPGGYPATDYTPMFINQILDTIGHHFDRHQITHNDLLVVLHRLEHKLEKIMADFATFVTDFNSFISDVNTAVGTMESQVADLKAQLAAALAAGTAPAGMQESIDAMETAIADARAKLNSAPAAPTDPGTGTAAPATPTAGMPPGSV